MASIDSDSLILVGRIGRAHGVRGEVKVVPETDDPNRVRDLETVYVGADAETARPHRLEHVKFQQGKRGLTLIVKLVGVHGREAAETLRGGRLYAAEDDLPPLEEDEFFLYDLIGLSVQTHEGEAVGVVKDVLELPQQDVLVIERPDGTETLVPAVPEFVDDIDFDADLVTIRPIEGLL